MKARYFIVGQVILLFISLSCSAQREASNWLFNNFQIFFGDYGPSFSFSPLVSDDNNNPLPYAAIADLEGKVLIYTDSKDIRDKRGDVFKNGTDINGLYSIIIPRPGYDSMYYVFTLKFIGSTDPGNTGNIIAYSIVDLTANGGQGEVILKNQILYADLHGSFAISGRCDGSVYWLIGEANRNLTALNSDQLFVYKIDSSGISYKSSYAPPEGIGNSSHLRFSPRGDQFAYAYEFNTGFGSAIGVLDFNSSTGNLSNSTPILSTLGAVEFSPDASKVYFATYNSLHQYDLGTQVLTKLSSDSITDLRLALDGKIYLAFLSPKKAFGIIENPNVPGLACGYNREGLKLPFTPNGIPTFASIFIDDDGTKVNAGRDTTVCVRNEVVLGDDVNKKFNCQWLPANYLNDDHSPTPAFFYPVATDSVLTFIYLVRTLNGECSRRDVVQVKVNVTPSVTIHGSKSVCPGVVNVDYWATTQDSIAVFNWAPIGGSVSSINGKDSVSVSWGKTSNDASANLSIVDKNGCTGDFKFPVRINPVLQTETPAGADSVCNNLKENNVYQIIKTNGSEYTWGAMNGDVVSGQKSNQVSVNWQDASPHLLWVQEKSITVDTVCYGASDTLRIVKFQDPTRLILNNVTLSQSDQSISEIQMTIEGKNFFKRGSLFRKDQGEISWTDIADLDKVNETLIDLNLQSDKEIYQYQLNGSSRCYAQVESLIHNTILLKGSNDETKNSISLHWNAYINWLAGVKRYEVLRKTDQQNDFEIFASVPANDTLFNTDSGVDGFYHHFRIRAVCVDSSYNSLSNETLFEFKHELFIPNVITPNGDHLNDTFEIKNILAYKQNELIIVNRWGNEVFHAFDYSGGWDGRDLSTGVYYLVLKIPTQPVFRGWLEILR